MSDETPAVTTDAAAPAVSEIDSFAALVDKMTEAPEPDAAAPTEPAASAPAAAKAEATTAAGEPTEGEAAESEPDERRLPDPEPAAKFKPRTRYEHIQARKIAQLERQQSERETARQSAEQRFQELERTAQQYQAKEAALQAAIRGGNPDEILKSAGLPVNLERLNRMHLEKQGAIRPPDPEVLELRQQVKKLGDILNGRQETVQQQAREAAQRDEYQQELGAITADLESHPDVRAQWLAQIPGAVDTLYQVLNSGEEGLTFDSAAGRVFHTYQELKARMLDVPGQPSPGSANPEKTTGTVPAKNASRKPSSIPRGGGTPGATPNGKYSDDPTGFDAFLRDQGAIQ